MKKFAKLICLLFVFSVALSDPASVSAASSGDATKTSNQDKKPKHKARNAQAPKKIVKASPAAGCSYNEKRWGDGQHCMKQCNAQGTLCDMQICKQGEWKNFSSCFGPKAVSPNCPAACG